MKLSNRIVLFNDENLKTDVNSAAKDVQTIYIQAVSGTLSVNAPSEWVSVSDEPVTGTPPGASAGQTPHWTTKKPTYQTNYPVIFVAEQRRGVNGQITCTTPLKDDSQTIIDGGHITTGTIDASEVDVTNINAHNIRAGTLDYLNISENGMDIIKDGVSVAYYGDESRVGNADSYHTKMTDLSIELNKGEETMFSVMATGETTNVKNTQMLLKSSGTTSGTSRTTTVILDPGVTYSFLMYGSPTVGFSYSFTTSSASTTSQTVTSDDGHQTMTVSYVRQYETVNGTTRIAHVKATVRQTRTATSYSYYTISYAYTTAIEESSIHFFGTNNVLWSGAYYMAATHTATLSESVSSQLNGIVLAWSYYNKTTQKGENHDWHYTFIPKQHIFAAGGTGINCGVWGMDAYFGAAATKYVYVNNDSITGYENNDKSGTGTSGIKYDNTQFVLRYVLGV